MASDTSLIFYGAWHLAGETVQAMVCGLDCGDYTVSATGTITVPFGSDDQGLLTAAYVQTQDGYTGEQATVVWYYLDDEAISVTIPVVIGKQYTSDGQTLRPALGVDMGLRTHGMGKTRRSHEFAALLNYAVEISFGTTFSNIDPITLTIDTETAWPQDERYTGVYRGTLTDDYGYDSMICWRVNRPWPAMVCAVSAFLIAEE